MSPCVSRDPLQRERRWNIEANATPGVGCLPSQGETQVPSGVRRGAHWVSGYRLHAHRESGTPARERRLADAHRCTGREPPVPVIDPPAVLPTRDPLRQPPGFKNRAKIDLPSSVITEPLMVWRGTGTASLTCTRVIPYPDGFEIELVAQGLLIEDAEMPWGRSSRGFWHFEGFQLTVGFADGRSHRVDDLTSETREGPVTVSPFRRDDSSPKTLWLWVMPTPSDGPVRLVATWPLRGIEQATVEFHAAGSP